MEESLPEPKDPVIISAPWQKYRYTSGPPIKEFGIRHRICATEHLGKEVISLHFMNMVTYFCLLFRAEASLSPVGCGFYPRPLLPLNDASGGCETCYER